MLLALTGNALMVPRALFTRDVVWIAGTCWACTAGWGQLLSMFLGTSAITGYANSVGCVCRSDLINTPPLRRSYLAAAPFAAVSVVLVSYMIITLVLDSTTRDELKPA